MRCPNCNSIIPNESAFCPDCGSIVTRVNSSQNLEVEDLKVAQSKVREIRDSKFYMVVCYAVALVITAIEIVFLLADSYETDNPVVAILSFLLIVLSVIEIAFMIKVLICLSELGQRNITLFHKAFVWGIVSLVCSVMSLFVGDNAFATLLSAVVGLVFTYYYVESFRQLMEPKFPETASKWQFYWNLSIGLLVSEIVAGFIAILLAGTASTYAEVIVALLLILAPAIVSLALPFVELRYLDETAGRFDYWASCIGEKSVPSWMNADDIQ